MPKIEYKSIKFQQKSLELINLVNQVVEEYQAQGYELTLRQAYYQLVARGYIPNNERSYKNIGNLINDGRLAGLIDWHSITVGTELSAPESLHLALSVWCAAVSVSRAPERSPVDENDRCGKIPPAVGCI